MSNTAAVALTVPDTRGWDFGDYPYGLEPLTLPHPGNAWMADGTANATLAERTSGLLAAARSGDLVTTPATAEDLERLFWFRWITGHHISFVLWRLLAGCLARLEAGEGDAWETSAAITEYVRAYGAMLLYTGSSTRPIYNQTIRPSMYRLHSTFSGTWAADYPAVRSLFRGRRLPPVVDAEAEALTREVGLSHQIHLGVASKLVVDGRSLLQHLVDNPAGHQPRMWASIFDCYFLTLRAPVTGQEVLSQLLRRCKAVVMDLVTNGLYPAVADYGDHTPAELRTPAVLERESELVDIVLRVPDLAVGSCRSGERRVKETW
ncbi:hypothetical protein PS467_24905 [Streptomyces luomodiensis]|uniref:L-tyrosine 3-hydroxylase n=1 Tax=Streptomyces luomodiensis TaxID=3026192 RepID=A0ABY9V0F2_9ACTN|nr:MULTISPECIES: hypothetical protein [unclassified Streptomyces]WAP57774.1 hypothetical protein N6H00_23985 [Streptomyces sp. S465]WNE98337.1 hypothetical protein PS467_24905 [Streptomyces sp. SCA4-21]